MATQKRLQAFRDEKESKAKLRALEIAEEEAREARIAELQAIARRDNAVDQAVAKGEAAQEE